jgi:hypothetical protein
VDLLRTIELLLVGTQSFGDPALVLGGPLTDLLAD